MRPPSGPGPYRLLLSGDAVGGIWRYCLELAAGLAVAGVETLLAVLGPPPDTVQRAEAAEIRGLRLVLLEEPLDWMAESPARLAQSSAVLSRLAESQRVDAIQLNMAAHAAGVAWPAPVVAVAHSCVASWWRSLRRGPMPADLAWRAAATARGLRAADAVIAPSRSFARLLSEIYGLLPIAVVPNGAASFEPESGGRGRFVLSAGRLWDEGKNLAVLERAAAQLDVPVHVAGAAQAPGGGAARFTHLRLLGQLPHAALSQAMTEAALFAAPSRYEPFGLAVLEAAQRATPLLLSDIPTFRELWDGAAMFLPAADAQRWAAAVRHLMGDRRARQRLGAAAAARAARYSREALAAATLAVHRSLRIPALAAAGS